MSETRQMLLKDVCEKPEDWTLRSILADNFEDSGESKEAEAVRWQVENKKRPYHGTKTGGTWFNNNTIAPGLGDGESDLPEEIYKLLEGGKEVANHRTYDTRQAAEEAFQAAWLKWNEKGRPDDTPKRDDAKPAASEPESDE